MRIPALLSAALISVMLSGCESSLLLHIYAVEGSTANHTISSREPDRRGLTPLPGVKFFFYPNSSDSIITLVPEREFLTNAEGTVSYSEMVSPAANRIGALIAMKPGFGVDTVYFPFAPGDTVNILLRMRRR